MVNASNFCSSICFLTQFVENRRCFGMLMVWSSNQHSKSIHQLSLMFVLVQACHVLRPLHLTRPSGCGMLTMSVKMSTLSAQSCPWKLVSILCGLFLQTGYSLRTFMGHSATVMSLDFHPNKDDLICSCDGDGEIRYWSINNGSCSRVFKVQ